MGLIIKNLLAVTVLSTLLVDCSAAIHPKVYRTINLFRKCLISGYPLLCVKEASLDIVNETLVNDKPMLFYDMVEIGRNPNYNLNNSIMEDLPRDLEARSLKIDEILHDKIEDYFKSRTIKFIMAPAVEGDVGRKKGGGGGGGGGKKGGMMVMGMIGMACMMGQMMMGKVAFMAGTAMIIAKVALFMSAMMGMKKMGGGGGGGGESHVVYAAPAEHSHGGGGGGWHRSMGEDSYRAPYPESSGGY